MPRTDLQRFGTFSMPSFGGVGEPYQDGQQSDSRTKGGQFITNNPRKGQLGDNWNRGKYGKIPVGTFKRLYEGEKHKEEYKIMMEAATEEAKRNLTTNGFRYSSKPKKSSGVGDYYGTIAGHKQPFPHMQDYEVLKHGEKPEPVTHELPQIKNSPMKKGYGASTPGCIFGPGPLQGESGLGKYGGREYKHSVDPYDAARLKEKEMMAKDTEAIAGRPAYKTMSHSVDFFDQPTYTCASSAIFTENPRLPERPPKSTVVGKYAEHDRAFRPAQAPKSGPQGTFEKFPKYIEDPLDLKIKEAKEEAAKNRIEGAAPFKPTGTGNSIPQPSILFHTYGSGAN